MFPGLRDLIIERCEIQALTRLLEMCSEMPLSFLDVGFGAATETFYYALAASCLHPALKSLSVTHQRNQLSFEPDGLSPSLRVLFCFPNITYLAITSPLRYDLNDVIIGDLACAWPGIQILRLRPSYKDTQPQITLKALHSLARHP